MNTRLSNWLFVILLALPVPLQAQGRDLYSDSWVATDALGRSVATFEETGPPRTNRTVGIFYFLWQGSQGGPLYDITKLLHANPSDPQYGPIHAFHWWGEPEAGYYRATDPWVIRRNASMLVDAGVDFLYLDASNALTYLTEFKALATLYEQIRSEGGKTPQIAFLTKFYSPATMQKLYDDIYSKGYYSDLWFEWQGKPLMLGYPDQDGVHLSQQARDFFTFRESWAWDAGQHRWQWLDNFPQDYGWDTNSSVPEQIPVAVASHSTNNIGTSYSNGRQPPIDQYGLTATTGQGQHFAEQIDRALQVDPEVLFITGWNEWIAQRFVASDGANPQFLGKDLTAGQTFFVDAYNEEYNRDIEPMKGGHTDNYYYQLVDAIRRYKGVAEPQKATSPQTISIDGNFADWTSVGPEYRDTRGDTAHRDWDGWGGLHYTNATGRNDFLNAKVTYDEDNVYFLIETTANITSYTDQSWMMLFIDADLDNSTGWHGYDFVVNRSVTDASHTTLQVTKDGMTWNLVGQVAYQVSRDKLELAIPREMLRQDGESVVFNFHWADNMQNLNDIAEFFINGDSAPNRRFDYRYQGSELDPPSADLD